MNQQFRNYFFMLSGILVFAGAILYATKWLYAPYLYAFGAAGITLSFLTAPIPPSEDLRHRRLHRINVIAGISMLVSSVFMFRRSMEWVVFLLISAFLILYASFIPTSKK